MLSWKRPDSVGHPRVWRRAAGRKPVEGKVPSFVVQDVPEDRVDDLLDFFELHFARDEPLWRCVHPELDGDQLDEVRQLWKALLSQRVSVVAFLEDDGPRPRIAGTNFLAVTTAAEKNKKLQVESPGVMKIIKFCNELEATVDPFERYGVQEYMMAVGLSVAKEFQGQGLGKELLKARFDVGRAVGVKLTVTAFTAKVSQVLAIREGFEELARINYADYKVDGKEVFPGVSSECAILMAKRIQ